MKRKNYIQLPKISEQKERKKWYHSDSMKHPAKAHIGMMQWILKKFVENGDIVLDPMAGIGTTLIEGIKLFPNCIFIGVEYEPKFVEMANKNIKKAEEVASQDLFMRIGKAVCIQGDARELTKVLKEKVDKCIFSPPFGKAQSGGGIAKKGYQGSKHSPTDLVGKRSYMPENIGSHNNISNLKYGSVNKIISSPPWGGKVQHKTNYLGKQKRESGFEYSDDPDNIGNLPHGQVDKIISSPPYGEGLGHGHGSKEWAKKWKESGIHNLGEYPSDMPDNIGNLPHGRIDKIITSPPYSNVINQIKAGHQDLESQHKAVKARAQALAKKLEERDKELNRNWGKNRHTPGRLRALETMISGYSVDQGNIGNLKHGDINNTKSKTYLGEMLKVYNQCYQVLKPDGLMILITKDFIRNKKRVPLTEHTIKLCELVGFKHIATYHRKIENPSFWRILYRQKYPDADQVNEEDITVFKKI